MGRNSSNRLKKSRQRLEGDILAEIETDKSNNGIWVFQ
jgi:hypothetical protein